jgi:type IV fimbrial biogenesis protein FimT
MMRSVSSSDKHVVCSRPVADGEVAMYFKRRFARHAAGFVLPELLVTFALLALMAVLSVPSFDHWLLRDQVDRAARSLLATFSYARNEALRLGGPVSVCRAADTAHCAKASAPCGKGAHARADNWACGWLVTSGSADSSLSLSLSSSSSSSSSESESESGHGSGAGAGAAEPLRVLRRYPPSAGLSITSPANVLAFTPPAGQLMGGFRSFEIAVVSPAWATGLAQLTRCIRLAIGGRPRISDGACGHAS